MAEIIKSTPRMHIESDKFLARNKTRKSRNKNGKNSQ